MIKVWYKFRKWCVSGKRVPFQLTTGRVLCTWLGVLIAFSVLVVRLVYVMTLNSDWLIAQGNDRVLRTISEHAKRGTIKDRNGEPLAVSVPVKAVSIYCKDFHRPGGFDNKEQMQEVAKILGVDYEKLMKRVDSPINRYVYVARQVQPSVAEYIASLKIPGIIISNELRRYYPYAEMNAQLIGRTNIDGEGIEGLEKQYNELLVSTPEKRRQLKDRQGNVIANLGVVAGKEGKDAEDLVLSIDQRLQQTAYKAIKYATEINQATSGSIVLIDVKSGEILAMANTPSYNPNNKDSYASYKARNRAVTDLYEPGSTTKPLIALGALAHNHTNWREVFNTLPFPVNGKMITDSHRMARGNLHDVIKYSSNTAMAQIALRMGPEQLMDALLTFGYGEKTAVDFVGENPGRLPLQRKRWSQIEQATVGFGYGIMATPLQIAQAYTILANYGIKKPLSILKVDTPPEGVRVLDEQNVRRMLVALETVVEDGGTGTQAMIAGYRVGGKTGTAKVAIAGHYGKDYVGTFVGLAPMSDPRFVLVVLINEPHAGKFYGGVVAGPAFHEVMQRALVLYGVKPDDLNPDGTIKTVADKMRIIRNKHRR